MGVQAEGEVQKQGGGTQARTENDVEAENESKEEDEAPQAVCVPLPIL